MTTTKLKNHKSAQCHVSIEDNVIKLISYSTTVIIATKINDMDYDIKCTGLYSATTKRHISWFISEYFRLIDYYVIKDGYVNSKIIITQLTK